ncbi:MAG: hypothetical protein ABI113_11905 [Mucilaginibacter sp.]
MKASIFITVTATIVVHSLLDNGQSAKYDLFARADQQKVYSKKKCVKNKMARIVAVKKSTKA